MFLVALYCPITNNNTTTETTNNIQNKYNQPAITIDPSAGLIMLFENPAAVAAKLPYPYNVPPPIQAAAAAAAAAAANLPMPNLR